MDKRIVSWFSCGAASAVATKIMLSENKNVTIVYCQVKEEHPDNMRFLADCEKWFGQKIIILKNETYDGSCFNVFEKNYFRTPKGSPCTRELKRKVRLKFQRLTDIIVFGFTLEEQERLDDFIDRNNVVDIRAPLIEKELTKDNVLAMIERAGIELPEMYKLGYEHNNCFSGRTRFITDQGVFQFIDKVGETVKILNRFGWQEAKVEQFGKQKIFEIELKKEKRNIVIETTKKHRWIVPKYTNISQGVIDKSTDYLKEGDRPLISFNIPNINIDRKGVQHGFTFGDGSLYNENYSTTFSKVYIDKCKKEVLKWFNGNISKSMYIHGLPESFKELPDINKVSREYLLGFLAGWIASDGCVSKSGITISNKNKNIIDKGINIAKSLGMVAWTNGIKERTTNYLANAKLSTMIIPQVCVPEKIILRTAHCNKLSDKNTRPKSFKILSIKDTGRIEPVFCVTVDGKPEFTLEDNILTGNCIGCVKGGMGYWNKIRVDFPERFKQYADMEKEKGYTVLKDKEGPIYLHDLDPNRGRLSDEPKIECGIMCEQVETEYSA